MEKLIKGWKTCPLCGCEANFVCEKYTVTCKNCGAKWEKMWLTELGLTKPCADGVGKIYVGVAKSPDWWMKSPAERVKEMLKDKGRNIRRAGYAVLGLLALTAAFALATLLALAAPKAPDIETAKIMALCLVGCGIAMAIIIAYALIETGGLFEFILARLGKGDKSELESGGGE